ncbi:MAG TPA: AMIN domain-containing protein, partial [Candidatus Acidoferrum sp.]|nr:AMIN domain-containing protein [Candidatus Acidoferrum sp.]
MKTNWPALRNGCLILASLAPAAAPLLSQTRAAAAATTGGAVISSVAVTQAAARSSVRVEGEGELFAHATRMQNPDRLVLDFAGTRMAVQKSVIPGVSAPVRDVRLGQFRPDVARVVIDLTAASPYQIGHEGHAIVISFDSPTDSQVVATSPTLTASAANQPAIHYADAAPRTIRRQPGLANVAAPKFTLPTELTQGAAFGSFAGSTQPARPEERPAAQAAAQQAGDAAATVASAAQQPAGQAAAPAKYTGEPISVNLKDVDLRDFFRLIHEISGLNVVLDPAVKGSLTIVLDEVPWDQALDIVLQNNGLDKQLKGNVLRIATRATLKQEA